MTQTDNENTMSITALNNIFALPKGMKVTPIGLPDLHLSFVMYAITLMKRKDYVVEFEARTGFRPALLTTHLECPAENHNAQFFDWVAENFWNKDPMQLLFMSTH